MPETRLERTRRAYDRIIDMRPAGCLVVDVGTPDHRALDNLWDRQPEHRHVFNEISGYCECGLQYCPHLQPYLKTFVEDKHERRQPAPMDLEGATVMIDGVLHALKHVEDRRERRITIKFKREYDIEPNKFDHRS